MPSGRRRSGRVALVLIGAAAAGCSPSTDQLSRDHYERLEDCVADWGAPDLCRDGVAGSTSSAGGPSSSSGGVVSSFGRSVGVHYYGPQYVPGWRDAAMREARESMVRSGRASPQVLSAPFSNHSVGSTTVRAARGGFGATARARAGGG